MIVGSFLKKIKKIITDLCNLWCFSKSETSGRSLMHYFFLLSCTLSEPTNNHTFFEPIEPMPTAAAPSEGSPWPSPLRRRSGPPTTARARGAWRSDSPTAAPSLEPAEAARRFFRGARRVRHHSGSAPACPTTALCMAHVEALIARKILAAPPAPLAREEARRALPLPGRAGPAEVEPRRWLLHPLYVEQSPVALDWRRDSERRKGEGEWTGRERRWQLGSER